MNYAIIYEDLIERARNRKLIGYSEKHHVVPVCMGGGHEASNLVQLTAEEHFVAHKLLVKMYPENWKVAFALLAMSRNTNGMRPNNKLFGWTRRRVAAAHSAIRKGKKRPAWIVEKIGRALTGRVIAQDHRSNLSTAHKGKTKSKEHLAKISAALKGRSDIGMFGRKHSPETIAKMRATALGRKHAPEVKTKMRDSYAKQTPEQRSARAHKAWETKRLKKMIGEQAITV
jgi:NUMOD3 motif